MTASTSTLTRPAPSDAGNASAAPIALARRVGALDECSAEQVLERLPRMALWPGWGSRRQRQTLAGAAAVLAWLARLPGQGWQQRWLAGADTDMSWLAEVEVPGQPAEASRKILIDGLAGLLLARVLLPSYGFLATDS